MEIFYNEVSNTLKKDKTTFTLMVKDTKNILVYTEERIERLAPISIELLVQKETTA